MADSPSLINLPLVVERLLTTLCQKFNKPPLEAYTRMLLSGCGEENARKILRDISRRHGEIGSLDVLIIQLVNDLTPNGFTSPTSGGFSPSVPDITPTRLFASPQFESSPVQSSVRMEVDEGCNGCSGNVISSQLIALGELEFRKAFLILSYIQGNRLEEVVSTEDIRQWKDLPMRTFEYAVWKAVGFRGIKDEKRRKQSVDWDCGAAHIYHCCVSRDGTYKFEGPFLANERNILQRTLGDDNILMVKFDEEGGHENSFKSSSDCPYQLYEKFLKEGILVGLRRYRFFVFKDGGKEEKKKDKKTSCVKCFFVRMESVAYSDSQDYILSGKTVREARAVFMHLDTLEKSLSNYMARFSLVLSKTLNLDIDLSCVKVEEIADIKGKDENILTDGTGFISEDLAVKCPKSIFKGSKKAHYENFSESHLNESPLLIQFRLFNKGSAVKGTLLINKKLPPKTIHVRPSMIKVKRNPNLSDIPSSNSLEVVGTSNRPKQALLSKNLILLLSYGGVPQEFFMDSLCSALEDAKGALINRRTALRVALNSMDDCHVVKRMILSGIPLEESILQYRLSYLMNEGKKTLKAGKIPVAELYYLMGTTDPTGLLKEGEVCIILHNGPISGKVLVYRNPGLHFGDIHILNARYVDCLKDFVGNAKYGIFFPCEGQRSIADEIAGGDYDGDMYFVSRNPQLLETFREDHERWTPSSPITKIVPNKKPADFLDQELEEELFKLFLEARFNSSNIVGTAADSWTAIMDRFITLGPDSAEEKRLVKDNLCRLIDIYYDALDAPKSGKTVELPSHLKAELFPHYMEKNEHMSYRSTSIMGLIYDKVNYELQNRLEKEIWKLSYFSDPAPSVDSQSRWEKLHKEYRVEMSSACNNANKDLKNVECEKVIKKYKEILYGAAEFNARTRKLEEIYDEARAIYNIVYDYARSADVEKYLEDPNSNKKEKRDPNSLRKEKCMWAWKVAGEALCEYYISSVQNEQPMACSISALKEILN